MNASSPLDPVSVVTLIFAGFVSEHLASVLGPYAVIFLSAIVGAGWALSLRPASSLKSAALFMLFAVGITLLLSVSCAMGLQMLLRTENINWLLAPVAIGLGRASTHLDYLGRWILERLGRLIERRLDVPPPADRDRSDGH